MFHFSCKILNALSEKIVFLCNFCQFFPVFYEWNRSINGSFQFSRIFFPGRGFIFFSWGGFIFNWRAPHRGIGFDLGVLKKIMEWGRGGMPSTRGNLVHGSSLSLFFTFIVCEWFWTISVTQHNQIIDSCSPISTPSSNNL